MATKPLKMPKLFITNGAEAAALPPEDAVPRVVDQAGVADAADARMPDQPLGQRLRVGLLLRQA